MQSFQDLVALGIDFNNAHVQPTGEYHFHGVNDTVMAGMEVDPNEDIVHIGTTYLHIFQSMLRVVFEEHRVKCLEEFSLWCRCPISSECLVL